MEIKEARISMREFSFFFGYTYFLLLVCYAWPDVTPLFGSYIQQLREGVHNFFVTFIEVLRDRPPGHDWELEPGVTCGDYLFGMLQVIFHSNEYSLDTTWLLAMYLLPLNHAHFKSFTGNKVGSICQQSGVDHSYCTRSNT